MARQRKSRSKRGPLAVITAAGERVTVEELVKDPRSFRLQERLRLYDARTAEQIEQKTFNR